MMISKKSLNKYEENKDLSFELSDKFLYMYSSLFECRFFDDYRYKKIELNLCHKLSTTNFDILSFEDFFDMNLDVPNLYYNSVFEREEIILQLIEILIIKLIPLLETDENYVARISEIWKNTEYLELKMGTSFVFDSTAYKRMIKGDSDWRNYIE